MQEIKVISGTPTAQLTALAKLQCIMIQSLEKSNPHVHTKMCVHTHMADTQRHTYLHICILYSSRIGWITIIIIIIIIVLASELLKSHSMEMNMSKEQHLSSLEGHGQPPQAQNALSEFTEWIS